MAHTRCIANPVPRGHTVDRRTFVGMLGALGAGAALTPILGGTPASAATAASTATTGTGRAGAATFAYGVMAGDPLSDGSVIWTRVTPSSSVTPVDVLWEVAEDAAFTRIAAGGIVTATAATDWTVKVPVGGLGADRWYHYRFTAGGATSAVGRLRTAPRPDATPDRLRFVFSSCQQRTSGTYYVAHTAIAQENADFFMHLGDYVYVSDTGTITLDDYRGVHKTFKSNPALQEVHAALPTVAIWDDGEFSNYVNRFYDPARLQAGARAWHEYMPVLADPADPLRIYRQFAWGALSDIVMIDVRTHSDGEVPEINSLNPDGAKMMDTSRSLLGADQRQWLTTALTTSQARWRMIGQGFMMMPWRLLDFDYPFVRQLNPKFQRNAGIYAPTSDWDDYQGDRRHILSALQDAGVRNNVFCSGDLHLFFAGGLQPDFDDPASPTVAFDFCTGSLTADPDPRTLLGGLPPFIAEELIHWAEQYTLSVNPYMGYCNLLDQGYVVVDVTPDAVEVAFRMVNSFDPNATPRTGARFRIPHDATALQRLG